jgi:multidrug resistance efflux pump
MSDAPERIWVATWREGDWSEGKTLNDKPCIEYVRADRIEALTEQLAAARQDAKFAEDELEMQEQEACMMENDYTKLEKERDALEAKLAKAVEALEYYAVEASLWDRATSRQARATLAEIKGGNDAKSDL